MHTYANNGRYMAPLLAILAMVAVAIAPVLSNAAEAIFGQLPDLWKPLVPGVSAMSVFGGLFWLFENHIWKWKWVRGLLLIPDLNGSWGVEGRTTLRGGAVVPPADDSASWSGTLAIRQSWLRLIVVQRAPGSDSRSIAASVYHRAGEGFRLTYYYENEPSPREPTLRRHTGVCDLHFDVQLREAKGPYFTDWHRQSSGEMRVTRRAETSR